MEPQSSEPTFSALLHGVDEASGSFNAPLRAVPSDEEPSGCTTSSARPSTDMVLVARRPSQSTGVVAPDVVMTPPPPQPTYYSPYAYGSSADQSLAAMSNAMSNMSETTKHSVEQNIRLHEQLSDKDRETRFASFRADASAKCLNEHSLNTVLLGSAFAASCPAEVRGMSIAVKTNQPSMFPPLTLSKKPLIEFKYKNREEMWRGMQENARVMLMVILNNRRRIREEFITMWCKYKGDGCFSTYDNGDEPIDDFLEIAMTETMSDA